MAQSEDAQTPGWDAITAALTRVYGDQKPRHYGPLLHFRIGGKDPLDGVSVYHNDEWPLPHWHYVSYGMSELYAKESDNKELSGWGFEFTFRLKRSAAESTPPSWPIDM